ncbi:MAG: MBL fold metallo-hydrolase [Kofleriaceae bacterium]
MTPGIDEVYAELRARLGSGAASPIAPSRAAPGILAVPLATPTLPPATHTACYLVGERALVVVDPATPWPAEQARLDEAVPAGAQVALIVLTHHHGDHVGAAAALAARTGAPIAAHAATATRLAGTITVTRHLVDGEEIEADTVRLRALHTPGHAPGHLVLVDEASGAAIAGDLVAGVGTILIDPGPGEGHMATYLASLERVLAHGVGALLPAHGPVIADGPAKLRAYVAHRLAREAQVAAALTAAPQTLDQLRAVAYADTPPALAPIATRSLLAHLIKLDEDRRAVRVDDRWRVA